MNRKIFLLFIIVNICLSVSGIKSQTADDIIDSYAEAIGGADKIMSVNTLKYSGSYIGNGPDIPLVIIVKRDGKARTEMDFQGMKMIRACEGSTGWVVSPFKGTKDPDMLPAEEVKDLKTNAEIEGQLINYKEKGYKAEFLEKDDFEGSEVYKIKLTDKDGDVTYYFIDVDTSLLLMDKKKRKIGEKEVMSQTVYGNYQKIDGIMFPMAYEFRSSDDDQGQKLSIEKIELNIPVDDGIFKVPTN